MEVRHATEVKGDRCGKDHRAVRRARRAQELGHCVREDPRRERGPSPGDPRVRYHHSRAVAAQGLASVLSGEVGGHGSYRGLLEAYLLHAGGRLRVVAT